MLKNTIKKFAAFGLVAAMCVPCCFAFAQMQEEPNDEKSYSKEDLPDLIEKASREKNYFILDAYKSRVSAEVSGGIPRELVECLGEEIVGMLLNLSAEEFAEKLRAETGSREEAVLLELEQMYHQICEDDNLVFSPFISLADVFLSEVYGETYTK